MSRLLVNKAFVGIGDVVCQKPWVDNKTREYGIILAKKPKTHVLCLFACKPQIAEILLLKKVPVFVSANILPCSTSRRIVCDLPLVSLSKPNH